MPGTICGIPGIYCAYSKAGRAFNIRAAPDAGKHGAAVRHISRAPTTAAGRTACRCLTYDPFKLISQIPRVAALCLILCFGRPSYLLQSLPRFIFADPAYRMSALSSVPSFLAPESVLSLILCRYFYCFCRFLLLFSIFTVISAAFRYGDITAYRSRRGRRRFR